MAGNTLIAGVTTGFIYKNSGFTSTTLASFSSPSANPIGLGWDGVNAFIADPTPDKLYQQSGFSSTVLVSFASPSTGATGAGWNGSNPLSGDEPSAKVFLHSGYTTTISNSFSTPATLSEGVAWDGTNVLTCNHDATAKIYKQSGFSSTVLDSFSTPSTNISGLGWDGANVINSDDGLKVYQQTGFSSTVTNSFSSPASTTNGVADDSWNGITNVVQASFLEPGGDATFNVGTIGGATSGFWSVLGAGTAPVVATDFVNGGHVKSIKYAVNSSSSVTSPGSVVNDIGGRCSVWIYLNALPSAAATIIAVLQTDASTINYRIRLTSGGVLQMWNGSVQLGSNGSTLSTGVWYRLSIAHTIASSTVNTLKLFLNGTIDITNTNASISTASTKVSFGNISANATLDMRSSDHYTDLSSLLTDTGNVWVTAKRPNANGTTNGFSTQIGSGGSGYGTGHSPQVNERALSNTNGWSMIGAGAAVTEEYNIESASTGDIDISAGTILDYMGWIDIKALVGENVQVVLNGANSQQAITSTETIFIRCAGNPNYPAGTGADIGVITDTSLTTVSLYECGIVVAYIPGSAVTPIIFNGTKFFQLLGVGV